MFLSPWFRHPGRAVLMSGAIGAPARYRSEHQAEELRFLGWSAKVAQLSKIKKIALNPPELIILHRVRFTPEIGMLMEAAHRRGTAVIFDIDDRLFEESHLPDLRERDWQSHAEEWITRARGQGETMGRCDGVLVSTEELAKEVRRIFPKTPVALHRNAVSIAMQRSAGKALRRKRTDPDTVRIGYFSGSHSHDIDFLACAEVFPGLFETHSSLELLVIGPLLFPVYLERYRKRILHKHFVPWQHLAFHESTVDIAIAPLEMGNPFTEAKSENKYLEAGLVRVPLIASPTGSFRRVIRHGENGMLAETLAEWFGAADTLIRGSERRRRIGKNAREDVLTSASTNHRAEELQTALKTLGCDLTKPHSILASHASVLGSHHSKTF